MSYITESLFINRGSVSDLTSKYAAMFRAAKVLRDSKFAAVNNVSL